MQPAIGEAVRLPANGKRNGATPVQVSPGAAKPRVPMIQDEDIDQEPIEENIPKAPGLESPQAEKFGIDGALAAALVFVGLGQSWRSESEDSARKSATTRSKGMVRK